METRDVLKNRRLELGLTMKEVAEKVGVAEATISRWESGDIANMRRDRIKMLSDVLKISPSIIMGWEEPIVKLQLSAEEEEMLRLFRNATPEARTSALMVLKANPMPNFTKSTVA